MSFPSKLRYASFLQYAPGGRSKSSLQSQAIGAAIKKDGVLPFKGDEKTTYRNGIEFVVSLLKKEVEVSPFLGTYLNGSVALVPVPRSAPLLNKDTLWPTKRICEELVAVGLGQEVAPFLKRVRAVEKAAFVSPEKRPNPPDHYESTIVDQEVPALKEMPLVLVDDIVTRGSIFVGMYRRLAEAFPRRQILCFALMSTESGTDIVAWKAPAQGTIFYYPSGKLHREIESEDQMRLF